MRVHPTAAVATITIILLALAPPGPAAACTSGPACWTQPYTGPAPGGTYLNPATGHLYSYDATTGALTDTGLISTSLCVGDRENRTHVAGVCEDVDVVGDDTAGAYIDQDGWIALVGTQYDIVETLNVNGALFASCGTSTGCNASPNLGVTFWWYLMDSKPLCADYPAGAAVAVDGHLAARDRVTGITFTSDDSTTLHCP